ncbi:MAG: DUF6103 family protein [Lachnospiraceae bacterium]|nr:DUF6103 family protein [Ruminococcus sp.]MCM1276713.1 DUF6103 family protein [Lachnospiraceae bacterium]
MKNTVTIALDDTKITALKMYLSEKNTSLDAEVSKFAEQLYGKTVPQNVRDFIEMTAKKQSAEKPKPTRAKPTDQP